MKHHIRKPKTNRDADDLKVVVVGMFITIFLLVFTPSRVEPAMTAEASTGPSICHMTTEMTSEKVVSE